MLTKTDFQKAISDSIAAYPAVAPLYQAGDPRVLQNLDAMATMLAMLSAQIETAMAEPFEKVRDATVLADAAMRGIVRKGSPCRVLIKATNKSTDLFVVESGRVVIDSAGLYYKIETGSTVLAGSSSTFEATQIKSVFVAHTVSGSEPFYSIEIPSTDDDSVLCAISVSDADGELVYRDRYVNTFAGERVFHVEADDRQRVYVRFGFDGVVGVQPLDGAEIGLTVFYTSGAVDIAFGSPFSFEYIGLPIEAAIDLTMEAMLTPGQNPPPMSVLRDIAKYPSVYDNNAVFMGEFDFLVRRNFSSLRFLSVWNESAEEQARGPSIDNINTLFVACVSADGSELVLNEQGSTTPVFIDEASLTGTQKDIRAKILSADDSYKVKFYTPVRSKIEMVINAVVSTSYVATDVKDKITEAIISAFGEFSDAAKRGRNKPLYQQVYALLRLKVAALSAGRADLTVTISESTNQAIRPEMWRFVSEDSLTVNVSTANVVTPSWGG